MTGACSTHGAMDLDDPRSVLTFLYVKHLEGSMYRVNMEVVREAIHAFFSKLDISSITQSVI